MTKEEPERLGRDLAERVVIILVEPQYAGNVGAVARAMNNFGLRRLVLVNPPAWDPETARWHAPNCESWWPDVKRVATTEEALEGVHVAYAATARRRRGDPIVHDIGRIADAFVEDDRTFGLLFGREDHGLSNEDVRRCDGILRIATSGHASLNLAQAVVVTAHTFFERARQAGYVAPGRTLGGQHGTLTTAEAEETTARDRKADLTVLEPAAQQLVGLLDRVGYLKVAPEALVLATARQALQRADLSVRHTEALRGMVRAVEWALDNPDLDPRAPRKMHRS